MIRRESAKIMIEGAEEAFRQHFTDLQAGIGTPWAERSDTYMYIAQMRAAGWPAQYADLITIAGYGPSFAYAPRSEDRWNAHYFPVSGRDERIEHATGHRYRWRQYQDLEGYWQALKSAIDRGRVVHGPNEEDILFIGYEDADRAEDRKIYPLAAVFVDESTWSWEQFTAWHARPMVSGWLGVFEERVVPWPPKESAIEVMELMVRLADGDDPRRQQGDGVVWGIEGIKAYGADLADMSKSGATTEDGGFFQGGWRGCHNVYPQMSGRPAAAAYLEKIAPLFEPHVRSHIETAVVAYRSATLAWMTYDSTLGRAQTALPHEDAWQTESTRRAGAEAVQMAAEHERAAVFALKKAITNTTNTNTYPPSANLKWDVPPDTLTAVGNSFGRALAIILQRAGIETDYATIMGDLGQAFAIQGVEYDDNLSGGYADVGWWPLDLFQMEARLPFLADAYGVSLTGRWADFEEVAPNPQNFYHTHFERLVRSEIAAGRPLIAVWHSGFVITGYDAASPPHSGWCVAAGKATLQRSDDYPKALYTYGKKYPPLDRLVADREALAHAIALGESQVETKGEWVTGRRAWRAWADHIQHKGSNTHHYWHANQRMQLVAWRRSAVDYLTAMARRQPAEVARRLLSAARIYETQVRQLAALDISHASLVEPGNSRHEIERAIGVAAQLDDDAIAELKRAVEEMAR